MVFQTILLITGLLGAWVLWGVCVGHETQKRSSRYVVETVSLRLALVVRKQGGYDSGKRLVNRRFPFFISLWPSVCYHCRMLLSAFH